MSIQPVDSTAQTSDEVTPAASKQDRHPDHQDTTKDNGGTGTDNSALSDPVAKAEEGIQGDATSAQALETPLPVPQMPYDPYNPYTPYDPYDHINYEQKIAYGRVLRMRRLWVILFAMIALLLVSVGTALGLFLILSSKNHHPLEGSLVIAASWLLAIGTMVGGALFAESRLASKDAAQSQSKVPRNSQAISQALDERVALQRSLEKFQELSQKQAKSSYRLAQIAIFAGFLLLMAGGAVAVRASATSVQFVVGGLATIGTAISGYIGATAIRMYNRAQAQMNFYYASPLVQYYLVQAQGMTDKLSVPGRKDKAMERVITETLNIASLAGALITRSGETPTIGRSRPDRGDAETTHHEAGQGKAVSDGNNPGKTSGRDGS